MRAQERAVEDGLLVTPVDETGEYAPARWERRHGCNRTHVGDAPFAHLGGTDPLGRFHYTRVYADGCRETRETACGKGQ